MKIQVMENKDNISREILVRYLKGDLPDEEAWKVEKAMQEDPFLAEAMEGLELATPALHPFIVPISQLE